MVGWRYGKLGNRPDFRPFLRAQELTIVLAALVLLWVFVLYPRISGGDGASARVYLDSREIMAFALRESDDYRIDLMKEYGVPVSFEVKGGGIRFVDVVCPDHICEKTGIIRTEGQTAVCMPNRVAVVMEVS